GDLWIFEEVLQVFLNSLSGAIHSQPGNVDLAIGAKVDGSIGTDEMFVRDALHPRRLDQRDRDVRFADDFCKMFFDALDRLLDREISDLHATICWSQVDRAAR